MDDIRICEATLEDVPIILAHRRAMFWDMGQQDEEAHRLMRIRAESFLREAIPRGRYRGWFAELPCGDVVAGAGVTIVDWPGSPTDPAPCRAWVQNVYTEPGYRGHGIARRLMEALIESCRSAGFVNVHLHASELGRPLYESLGFLPTNEMRLRLR